MRKDDRPGVWTAAILLSASLSACGGGGGSSSPAPAPTTPPAPPSTYTIGGNVSGLEGTGLALQLNGADTLSIAANGPFVFSASQLTGANYAVTVSSGVSGPFQTCTIGSGSGAVAAENITNVAVTCVTHPPVAAPTLTITAALKRQSFAYGGVGNASFYRLFEDPDGVSGYTQINGGLPGSTGFARAISVHRMNWAQARYTVAGCSSGGCGPSSAVTTIVANMLPSIGYIKASNSDASDFFGRALAISGDGQTMAIAAHFEDSNAVGVNGNQDDNSASNAGAVYIFVRSGTTWVQQAYLKASNAEAADSFGESVALSADGNTLAVGAGGEDSNAVGIGGDQSNNSAADAGAAYVFTRNGTTWTQQTYLKASNPNVADHFGDSIALSADGATLAVGANSEDGGAPGINGNQLDNSVSAAGAVYVFARSGTTWTQQAYVKASNPDAGDIFGFALSLSADGNTLAAGAHNEDSNATGIGGNQADNTAVTSGAVYVFTRSGSTWTQQNYLKASNAAGADAFGFSVSLSGDGNLLAVGAQNESSNATGLGGNQNDNSNPGAGAVYVFSRSGTTWSQQSYVKASNSDAGDHFGASVELSADASTLAVGASSEESGAAGINGNQNDNSVATAGAVYVFSRSASTWVQQSYVKSPNPGTADVFGNSLALSGDGAVLAIGAQNEDSDSNGVNGSQASETANEAGAVYLY